MNNQAYTNTCIPLLSADFLNSSITKEFSTKERMCSGPVVTHCLHLEETELKEFYLPILSHRDHEHSTSKVNKNLVLLGLFFYPSSALYG